MVHLISLYLTLEVGGSPLNFLQVAFSGTNTPPIHQGTSALRKGKV